MSGTKPHTVLVVDDDPTMRSFLLRALRQMNMVVVLAASLDEARERLLSGLRPDIIVTDYMLGDGIGSSVVLLARRLQVPAPALLVTATPESVVGRDGELFMDILHKPFRLSALYDALEVARQQVRPRLRSGTRRRAGEESIESSSPVRDRSAGKRTARAAGDDD